MGNDVETHVARIDEIGYTVVEAAIDLGFVDALNEDLLRLERDLRVEPAYAYVGELVHYLTLGEETQKKTYRRGDQFAPEIKYFSDCILHDLAPEPSAEEGTCDIRVVEAILAAGRSRRAVELPPRERRRRPSPAQADHERPVKRQETVNAPAPSLK